MAKDKEETMEKDLVTMKVTPRTKHLIKIVAAQKQKEMNEVLEELVIDEWEWMERDMKTKKAKAR